MEMTFRNVGLAGRYASALYDFAAENRILDSVVEQVQVLARLIEESPEFRGFLANRTLDLQQSRSAVLAVLERAGFSRDLQHFVGVVANNRRLAQLKEFLAAFLELVSSRRGVMIAEVSSAYPLSDVQRAQIQARLAEAGYSRVDIHEHIDATLLGGLVVRIGARLYDASIRSRLARLHHVMKGTA